MRYFIDTEFIESGPHNPIDLISIGIVAEDGREFYAQSSECDLTYASDWVHLNVLVLLDQREEAWKSLAEIRKGIISFVGEDAHPEFWGYFADYDWVLFCQIFGRMIDLPKGWPKFCLDVKQAAWVLGNPEIPKQVLKGQHNALADAKWTKAAYDFLHAKMLKDVGEILRR